MSIRELAETALSRYPFGKATVDARTGAIEASPSGFRAYNRRLRPYQRYQEGGTPRPALLVEGVAVCEGSKRPQQEQAARDEASEFEPRTELGRKLLALRAQYRASGGPMLLDWDELDAEVEARRGGFRDPTE